MSRASEVIKLIAANDSKVTSFSHKDFPGAAWDSKIFTELGAALASNGYVKNIHLESCGLANNDAKALADGLKSNKSVTMLNLSYNKIAGPGIQALAGMVEVNTTLEEVNVLRQSDDMGFDAESAVCGVWEKNTTLRRFHATLHDRKCNQTNTKGEVRNKEIARRIAVGKDWIDLDPSRRDEYAKQAQAERLAKAEADSKASAPIDSKVPSSGGPYTLRELTCAPEFLPDDVDIKKKESYLTPEEFSAVFGMTTAAFADVPAWKQLNEKKKYNLH